MKNKFFFKKFAISAFGCGMPVSTDGILLGSWAYQKNTGTILDIGSGTGLLSLMMAQRFEQAQITAIDIDAKAVLATSNNVADSAWKNRINVFHSDIVEWQKGAQKYDLIICNPPYFNHGEQAKDAHRATARHTDSLSHNALIRALKQLLNEHGSAHLILPTYEAEQFMLKAEMYQLYCARKLKVRTTAQKPVSRILFSLAHEKFECKQDDLTIHTEQNYSQDFIALTKDFYLKM